MLACITRAGSIKAFAESIQTDPNYISSIKSTQSKREIGDELAARMEAKYGYPANGPRDDVLRLAMAMDALPEADIQELTELIAIKLRRAGRASAANMENITLHFNEIGSISLTAEEQAAAERQLPITGILGQSDENYSAEKPEIRGKSKKR